MNLNDYLKENKRVVEQAMAEFFARDLRAPELIHRAMLYSLDAGGKRLRPILAIASAEAVGGRREEVLALACALEMIHTFSLVHDDLPAMDNDDLRRGKATNHKVFGESIAILAGDGLVAEAFRLLASAAGQVEPKKVLSIIGEIADATGYCGMIGGQVIDLESEGKSLTLSELERLHRLKTGRLITISVVSGAKWSGANEGQLSALNQYGAAIGLAFQIADDILDIEGTTEAIGKPQGSDVERHKATYPSIMGVDPSKKYAQTLVATALEALSIFDERAAPLRGIARYIIERNT